MGMYLSNILADEKDSTHHSPSIHSLDALTNQEVSLFHKRDPYRYLWFRVLIALFFVLILECVILVILSGSFVTSGYNQNVTGAILSKIFWFWVLWVFAFLEAYAIVFVLCEIHGDWLTDGLTRSHLPQSFQRNCGLTSPFIAMLCVLAIAGAKWVVPLPPF
jgi:hypothetical protein